MLLTLWVLHVLYAARGEARRQARAVPEGHAWRPRCGVRSVFHGCTVSWTPLGSDENHFKGNGVAKFDGIWMEDGFEPERREIRMDEEGRDSVNVTVKRECAAKARCSRATDTCAI